VALQNYLSFSFLLRGFLIRSLWYSGWLFLGCVWLLRFSNLATLIFLHLNTNDTLEERLWAPCGWAINSFVTWLSTRLLIYRVCFPIWLVDVVRISWIRRISPRRIEFDNLPLLSRRVHAAEHRLRFSICRPLTVKIILAFIVLDLSISARSSKSPASCLFANVPIWNLVCFDLLGLLWLVNNLQTIPRTVPCTLHNPCVLLAGNNHNLLTGVELYLGV